MIIVPYSLSMSSSQCLASVAAMQRPARYHGRATNYAVQSREERCFAGDDPAAGAAPEGAAATAPEGAPQTAASAEEGGEMVRCCGML